MQQEGMKYYDLLASSLDITFSMCVPSFALKTSLVSVGYVALFALKTSLASVGCVASFALKTSLANVGYVASFALKTG